MAISKKKRFGIFKRDEFQCQYCGRTPPQVVLEVDHIHPIAEGGDDNEINLITSCFDCNRGKGKEPLTVVPELVKEKHKRKREAREQLDKYNDFLMDERSLVDGQIEELGTHWNNKCARNDAEMNRFIFGDSRSTSIRRFLRDLPFVEVLDSIDDAYEKVPAWPPSGDTRTWKYFCGICWKKIKSQ